MTPSSLIKLINSLSGPEKRCFKLHCNIQQGNKEYMLLFELIDKYKNPDIQNLKQEFKKRSPQGSWENTCIYLGNMLIDSLVRAKKEKDIFFDLLHQLQEIRILKERSLEQDAFKQVKKVQQKAAQFQLHWIEYYCYRFELDHYSASNFPDLSDESLIKLQMKGKDVLKSLNHIHDHHSLYELLKHRLVHGGKITSEEGKKKLNDLVLSEMVLITGKSKSFESQKLHLLFQSFFFTDLGDYQSALKSFYRLNELLEKNETFFDNPPFDYLSALTGTLDCLRMLQNKTEGEYYLEKLKRLDQVSTPEYFRYLVRKTVSIQQIISYLESGELGLATEFLNGIPKDVYDNYSIVDEEKQSELYFYSSVVNFHIKNFRKAHLYIREIMNQIKLPDYLLISKAIRLLNIIIYYEKGELVHLEYEIRSYKRYFAQTKQLKTEKMIFKIIGVSAANKRLRLLVADKVKFLKELEKIEIDRYEQQLLKYFHFIEWMRTLIHGKTLVAATI
jgi:hypothetical protein